MKIDHVFVFFTPIIIQCTPTYTVINSILPIGNELGTNSNCETK